MQSDDGINIGSLQLFRCIKWERVHFFPTTAAAAAVAVWSGLIVWRWQVTQRRVGLVLRWS